MASKDIKAWIGAGVLALALAGCGGTPTKSSTGDYFDDTVISTKVKTALLADPDVKGTAVDVEVFRGSVQLSGFVRSEQEREKAERLARQVAGVQEVKNDLRLRQNQ
ncbi:MAG: BON domain-containing protein [Burkholderiales bacterium]